MRMKASWVLAAAGVALSSAAAMADYSREFVITATYYQNDVRIDESITLNLDTPGLFRSWFDAAADMNWFELNGGTRLFGSDEANSATLNGFRVGFREDPAVVANFNVAAGVFNTTFTITSTLLTFPAITNGVAIASAAISVTDSATFGDVGSIALTGLHSGGNAFTTTFNNLSSPFTFANIVPGGALSGLAPGSTHTFVGQSASFPLYDPVAGTVDDMQSQFRFTLSRFDRAAGTSTFEIIPAPGAAALLALGGLAVSRRRRNG